jgi:hypothetical protein
LSQKYLAFCKWYLLILKRWPLTITTFIVIGDFDCTLNLLLHIEFPDLPHHIFLLLRAQLGVDGEGKGFPGGLFRFRECAFLIPEVLITFLEMEGDGVIYLTADAMFVEEFF